MTFYCALLARADLTPVNKTCESEDLARATVQEAEVPLLLQSLKVARHENLRTMTSSMPLPSPNSGSTSTAYSTTGGVAVWL